MLDFSTDRQEQVRKVEGSIMVGEKKIFNYGISSHQFNLSKESEKGLAYLVLMVENSGRFANLLRVGLPDLADKNTRNIWDIFILKTYSCVFATAI